MYSFPDKEFTVAYSYTSDSSKNLKSSYVFSDTHVGNIKYVDVDKMINELYGSSKKTNVGNIKYVDVDKMINELYGSAKKTKKQLLKEKIDSFYKKSDHTRDNMHVENIDWNTMWYSNPESMGYSY